MGDELHADNPAAITERRVEERCARGKWCIEGRCVRSEWWNQCGERCARGSRFGFHTHTHTHTHTRHTRTHTFPCTHQLSPSGVPLQHVQAALIIQVPHPAGEIVRHSGGHAAVGGNGNVEDQSLVACMRERGIVLCVMGGRPCSRQRKWQRRGSDPGCLQEGRRECMCVCCVRECVCV